MTETRDIIRADYLRRQGSRDPAGHWYDSSDGRHLADGAHGSYGGRPTHLHVAGDVDQMLDHYYGPRPATTLREPVGVTEIASRAQVRPETVTKWRQRHPDFPAPSLTLAMGPVWEWATVEAWVAKERPTGIHSG